MIFRNIMKLGKRGVIRCLTSEAKKQHVMLQDIKVNFLKIGNGSRTVLCLPGVLGTMWTDFPQQINHLDKSLLTLIFMDMPGCGGSRPPNRKFTSDFYHKDAEFAARLMNKLDVPEYSLLGWSDGGISALILAAQNPGNVKSLVVWGSNAYVTSNDIKIYEGIREIDKWSKKMVEPFVVAYGKEFLAAAMSEWVDVLTKIEQGGGNICKDLLPKIKAPTLIVHGDKDPLVPSEHPEFLKENIKNSTLVRFPDGKHNLHLRYYKEFNDLVEKFFKEN